MRLIAVERRERDVPRTEDTGDDLSEASKAGNQNLDFLIIEIVERALRPAHPPPQERFIQENQQRPEHHRERDGQDQQIGRLLIENVLPRGECEQHERELPAGRERKAESPRRLRFQIRQPAQKRDRRELDPQKAQGQAEKGERL